MKRSNLVFTLALILISSVYFLSTGCQKESSKCALGKQITGQSQTASMSAKTNESRKPVTASKMPVPVAGNELVGMSLEQFCGGGIDEPGDSVEGGPQGVYRIADFVGLGGQDLFENIRFFRACNENNQL